MKSGVFTQQGLIGCYEVDMPSKKQTEVLVRTLRSSICGSDLHVGYYGWGVDEFPLPPGSPGHESICEVVDGEGVIGKQPIIKSGTSFSYNSFCPLETEFGMMKGHYQVKREDGHFVKIIIPKFQLISPFSIN